MQELLAAHQIRHHGTPGADSVAEVGQGLHGACKVPLSGRCTVCYGPAMQLIQLVVEKHSDGFVAYPLGLKGVVVGQGDTAAAAQADCESAVRFHVETFGPEVLESDSPVLAAFIAEAHA